MLHHRFLPALIVLLPLSAHAQDRDFNQDGKVDFNDVNATRSVEELEGLLAGINHPRGDQDGDGEVMFPDFLVFSANYGSAGDYTDGDLNLDGIVGFEDWPIHATNFGARSYRPPPPGIPCATFTISVDAVSSNIVLSGDGMVNGIHIQSDSGALVPGSFSDAGPFERVFINSSFQVAYGNLTGGISASGDLVLPVRISGGTEIGDIELSWSQPESYDTFPLPILLGDFNQDCILTAVDIDLLSSEVLAGNHSAAFDLNEDQLVNEQDRQIWVEDLVGTLFGDADLDGSIQFSDFLALSANFSQQGGWAEGDFNGSGDIQFADFLVLSANFGKSATAVAAVPEPSAAMLLLVGLVGLVRRRSSVSETRAA